MNNKENIPPPETKITKVCSYPLERELLTQNSLTSRVKYHSYSTRKRSAQSETGFKMINKKARLTSHLFTIRMKDWELRDLRRTLRSGKCLKTAESIEVILQNMLIPTLRCLLQNPAYFKGIKRLKFDFGACEAPSIKAFDLLTRMIEAFQSVESFSLSFCFCYSITDVELFIIGKGLRYLNKVQKLDLDFAGCYQITDKGLRYLGRILSSRKSLTNITLSFLESKATDEGVHSLMKGLESLKLKYLNLEFESCHKIRDHALTYFNNLKESRIIYLTFSYCDRITDIGLDNLGKGFSSLNKVKDITLTFAGCSLLTDSGLEKFGLWLNQIKSLKFIGLLLFGCDMITEAGLTKFKDFLPLHFTHSYSLGAKSLICKEPNC